MKTLLKELFFFSTEGWSPELPSKCHFIKFLTNKNQREAILVKFCEEISRYRTNYLVLVPKHMDSSFDQVYDQPIFTYVIHGNQFVNLDRIDLSSNKIILDWGGVTISSEQAQIWQCNP